MPDKSMRPLIPLERFRTFAEGLDHSEGLAFDADGTLWAGGELGQIYRIGSKGRIREISRVGGFCLGLTFSRAQELYVCNFKLPAVNSAAWLCLFLARRNFMSAISSCPRWSG